MMTAVFSDSPSAPPSLLGPDEPAPFTVLNPDGKARCLLVCDHAASRLPAKLGTLGLDPAELEKHASVDIGARDAAAMMAERLDAPAIVANYSRMAIDVNRRTDHPTMCPTTAEGVPVPGNMNLSAADLEQRVAAIYRPYHQELAARMDRFLTAGVAPALISIHSFTPVFFGETRPWDLGVLWAQDGRLPEPFMAGMRARGYTVGDNAPYDARILRGATTHVHADGRGLPNILIEYRNDHLTDPNRGEKIIGDSCAVFAEILADEALYTLYDGPQIPHDLELESRYFRESLRTVHKDTQT